MPIGFREDNVGVIGVLEILRAPIAIAVSVAEDDVLDLVRIEANLLHVFSNQDGGAIVLAAIDQDDPV